MRSDWRILTKTVALIAALSTLFWFIVAARWYQRHVADVASPAPQLSQHTRLPAVVHTSHNDVGLAIPVPGVKAEQLTDTFSEARALGARRHEGIDISAARGTPVVAAAAGRVEKLFLSKDGGNTIYVRSADGRRLYYYAHLDRYGPGLGEGMTVRQGDVLGAVGTSGNADPDAPHLHFAIWETAPARKWSDAAVPVNPYPLLRAGISVAGSTRKQSPSH